MPDKKLVLLVEDEFIIRDLIQASLEDADFQVAAAGHGGEAIHLLAHLDAHLFRLGIEAHERLVWLNFVIRGDFFHHAAGSIEVVLKYFLFRFELLEQLRVSGRERALGTEAGPGEG